jgi:hypothetical protein
MNIDKASMLCVAVSVTIILVSTMLGVVGAVTQLEFVGWAAVVGIGISCIPLLVSIVLQVIGLRRSEDV